MACEMQFCDGIESLQGLCIGYPVPAVGVVFQLLHELPLLGLYLRVACLCLNQVGDGFPKEL